ncbi:MAG: hotdog domain-containing protein [Myxococcota bacterium]|nr:hotdog domain-containing protein [Myxococcota bacterium]
MDLKELVKTPLSLFEEIFPGDTNAYGTAFGGKILALMDRAAGLAAARFARCNVVTASLDALEFRASVQQGEIAEIVAQVVYTSTHTCGVDVQVFALTKSAWQRRPCCRGILFMVAVGPDSKPLAIPKLNVTSPEEQARWNDAELIHKAMIERRNKSNSPTTEE